MRLGVAVFALVVALGVLTLVLFPGGGSKQSAKSTQCLSNAKQLGMGLQMYAEDASGRFPPADSWTDKAMARVKRRWASDSEMRCPELPPGAFGCALNAALAGMKATLEPEKVPLVYESANPGRNVVDRVASLPNPGRHAGKNSIVYADGLAYMVATH